jgi:hypothetical protein
LRGEDIFLYSAAFRSYLWPTQSPIQLVLGAVSLGMKRRGREADHSHVVPKLKMVSQVPNSPICLYAVVFNFMVKYRDNFSFLVVSGYEKVDSHLLH